MKIALIGYGKMGKTIERIAIERGHEIVARYNSQNPYNIDSICNADVAIEFSRPDLVVNHIKTAISNKLPLVVGTTAWSEYLNEIRILVEQQEGSLVYASNFSIGVNIFEQLTAQLASLLTKHAQYKLSIDETHHLQKLDAPSGTAVSLAETILANHSAYSQWELTPVLNHESLPIIAHRLPDVPGTHVIRAVSAIDTITLTHEAHNRDGFALGSILAAEFLAGKTGIFTMKDVLNLN
jgi:4-hydroxy-tetrahydrodipicolinate reductase